VSFSTPDAVPAGWYPDPSGTRQWRVWTGSKWSEVTRPYGESRVSARLAANLSLVQALGRVWSVGVVGVVGGLGLLVSVLAHWPGTAHPTPHWFALAASSTAVAMLALGSVVCAFGVRELRGRWSMHAVIPGVNFLLVSALVAQRLGRPSLIRNSADVVLLAAFAASYHAHAWLGVAPVIVAFSQTLWVSALVDRLKGPSIDEASAP
jgi:hypothetical protein